MTDPTRTSPDGTEWCEVKDALMRMEYDYNSVIQELREEMDTMRAELERQIERLVEDHERMYDHASMD
jgi:hypothetical protein